VTLRSAHTNNHRPGTLERRHALLAESQAAIRANHGVNVSLDTVAREINTSRRQLQRVYQGLSHSTFRDALRQVRIERACALLSASSLPVRDIAPLVGYRQAAEFSRTFRFVIGMPPGEYRRQHRNGGDGRAAALGEPARQPWPSKQRTAPLDAGM
jgi:transcriptional regulator GlxA family with amidase domain